MLVNHKRKEYIFPRVPLDLTIPEKYPDIEELTNVSVVPEVINFRYTSGELEITGVYHINITYHVVESQDDNICSENDFFGQLKLKASGLFEEDEEDDNQFSDSQLSTVTFSNKLHTYVSLDALGSPSFFRPLIVVENLEVKKQSTRHLKGELILGLVNKMERLHRQSKNNS